MKISTLFRAGMFALAAASLAGGVSIPTFAGGGNGNDGAAAKRAVPDIGKKVITNEDLEARYGKPTPASEATNSQAISASTEAAPAAPTSARIEALPPEQDPVWYAEQTVAFNHELAEIDNQAELLIAFRTPGNTPGAGTGLILNAPCEGISTDNRIAQLFERRDEIEAQLADLEDTARRNDLPPGIFKEAPAIVAAAEQRPPLSPAEERAALASRLDQLSDELTQTESVVEGMRADTAAQGMTLLQPNGAGGNMTTDLLERLAAKSNALQNQINTIEDDAVQAGIPARDLP